MKALSYTRLLVVAGAMLLATLTAAAQQEVAPDHYDGQGAGPAQKVQPVKTQHKAAVHKAAAAKHVASAKKSNGQEAAGK